MTERSIIHQAQAKNAQRYATIYKKALWGKNSSGIGHSGPGSTFENTEEYRTFLEHFIKSKKIKRVVDFGCGDWEFSQHINWNNCSYTGYDIVKSVIENNILKYSNESCQFIHANGLDENFADADLLICKDVLQHLSYENIEKFLAQIHKFKYCLITNDINPNEENSDIRNGRYRPLDLSKSPFNLTGKTIFSFSVSDEHAPKEVFLITHINRKRPRN